MTHPFTAPCALALLAVTGLAACKQAIDYDTASDEERTAYLDATSQGLYDGIKKTLLHGRGGVYMKMGDRKFDIDRRRIEIRVDVSFSGDEPPAFNNLMSSSTVLKDVCPRIYLGTPLEANDVKVHIRYAMEGGGTMLAALLSPGTCAPYAKS